MNEIADEMQCEAGPRVTYDSDAIETFVRAALSSPAPKEETGWRPIETAPKDGTRILVWFVHANAKFCRDPIADGWAAAHEAYWIDHNGGGWTWYGLCGVATHWMPLPTPPSASNDGEEK